MLANGNCQDFQTFSPDQLRIVQDVYLEISRSSWFDHDAANKEEFARYVIKMYQRGLVDPQKLRSLCLIAAQRKYSRLEIPHSEIERV